MIKLNPICKDCHSSYWMIKMGEQKISRGRLAIGYHCMNPKCKSYQSWQTAHIYTPQETK